METCLRPAVAPATIRSQPAESERRFKQAACRKTDIGEGKDRGS
jgi:hypothetical protein